MRVILFLILLSCIASVHLYVLQERLNPENGNKQASSRHKRKLGNDIENMEEQGNFNTDFRVKIDGGERKAVKNKSLFIGNCKETDTLVYQDNTIVDNLGPGVLNGTIEIYIDAPVKISCIKVQNQASDEDAAIPSFNSGGLGFNYVFIDVACKYNKGFHFYTQIYGTYNDQSITDNSI